MDDLDLIIEHILKDDPVGATDDSVTFLGEQVGIVDLLNSAKFETQTPVWSSFGTWQIFSKGDVLFGYYQSEEGFETCEKRLFVSAKGTNPEVFRSDLPWISYNVTDFESKKIISENTPKLSLAGFGIGGIGLTLYGFANYMSGQTSNLNNGMALGILLLSMGIAYMERNMYVRTAYPETFNEPIKSNDMIKYNYGRNALNFIKTEAFREIFHEPYSQIPFLENWRAKRVDSINEVYRPDLFIIQSTAITDIKSITDGIKQFSLYSIVEDIEFPFGTEEGVYIDEDGPTVLYLMQDKQGNQYILYANPMSNYVADIASDYSVNDFFPDDNIKYEMPRSPFMTRKTQEFIDLVSNGETVHPLEILGYCLGASEGIPIIQLVGYRHGTDFETVQTHPLDVMEYTDATINLPVFK